MSSTEVLTAFKELASLKQLDRNELRDLIRDGVLAALTKKYGPNVRADIGIDEMNGQIHITVLREVVETVEDPSRQVTLEEARWNDPEFQVGDVLEEDVISRSSGAMRCRPPSSASSSGCGKASAAGSARNSPTAWASCSRARCSRSSAGRSW